MELVNAWPDGYQARQCQACGAAVIKQVTQPAGASLMSPPSRYSGKAPEGQRTDPGSAQAGTLRPAKILRGRRT